MESKSKGKFDDVKTGDVVYLLRGVSIDTYERNVKVFWVAANVGKVTKMQFYANDERYKKSNGDCATAQLADAKKLGEETYNNAVSDQTEDFEETKLKVDIAKDMNSFISKLTFKYDDKNLKNIYKKMKEIKALYNNKI